MVDNKNELSKELSRVLRHVPWLYELELDEQGWVDVSDVLKALRNANTQWSELTAAELSDAVSSGAKRRHEFRGDRVRALYGHSVPGRLKLALATPPEFLFHGTSPDGATQIAATGLMPMSRQFVHLSSDIAMAVEVGRRKASQPVVLKIAATHAHAAGLPFYVGNEHVWLTDKVPCQFLQVLSR